MKVVQVKRRTNGVMIRILDAASQDLIDGANIFPSVCHFPVIHSY